jgi:streptogramin lyase
VRFDPKTLKPVAVYPVGDAPDLVISSGGYLWVTHHVLRDSGSSAVRNSGDRTLTRVDPATGESTVVGGGLAPCGLTADPSGDVWVANCFAGEARNDNVVRIDPRTLRFKKTWSVPSREGYFRGLAYGGGSLWISDALGISGYPQWTVTRIDPETGERHRIPIDGPAGSMAWSEGYGDLWMNNFNSGAVGRLDASTGRVETIPQVATNPVTLVVDGDTVWIGDWSRPQLVRLPAVGPGTRRVVPLPTAVTDYSSAVWRIDAGAGSIWAATPRLHALYRIDPKTNAVTRIPVPYLPSGVAADDDAIWVTVRGYNSG